MLLKIYCKIWKLFQSWRVKALASQGPTARTVLRLAHVRRRLYPEFRVSGSKHCGKAALRPNGIKPALLTLAPMGACVKSSSGKLKYNLCAISVLRHRRCVHKVSYFPFICWKYFAKWYFQTLLSSLVTLHQHVIMLRCSPALTLSTSEAFLGMRTRNYELTYSQRHNSQLTSQTFQPGLAGSIQAVLGISVHRASSKA